MKKEFAIRERPKGWLQIDLRSLGGKRIASGLENTPANRKLLEKEIVPEMVKKLKAIQSGDSFESSLKIKLQKVEDFGAESLARHGFERQPHVQRQYELVFNKHILPHLGKRKLIDIKPLQLVDWQNKVNETAGFSTLKKARVIVYQMFDDAILDEMPGLARNPFTGLKLPKRITPEREILPFSKDEINIILQNTTGYFASVISILIFSSIRPGELAALEWGDVSFETKEININKTLKRGGVIGLPKTSSSRRIIAMLKPVETYLREQYRLTGLKGGCIFLNRSKEPFFSTDYWNEEFKRVLKRCSLLNRNLYQCRHTFASQMLSNGEDLAWVSKTMGHKDPNITLMKYTRFIPGDKKERGKFLESWHTFWHTDKIKEAKA